MKVKLSGAQEDEVHKESTILSDKAWLVNVWFARRFLIRSYWIYASLSAVNNPAETLTDRFVICTRNANAVM